MSMAAIRTIARREVRDTLTDWRILMPVFILTFILPQLLVAASSIAIDFIGDPGTVIRLIPFAMLLVGFIPASFSLITALESFVGERERNSLESLLSMPIADSALYLGKLISSLLPPLLSALAAMCVYAFTLRLRFPQLFFAGLTTESFTVVILLIVAKAVMMVAGAVIISSHTTSIRAANLLASFVLLPTATVVQLEALLMISQRWDMLWQVVVLLTVVATALVRTGMGAFNREEILSREHEQFQLKRLTATFKQFLREYQPAGVAPGLYRGLPFSASRFYRRELPALLREYRLPIAMALIAALAGLALGGYVGQHYKVSAFDQYLANVGVAPAPGPGLVARVFLNNVRVTLLSSLLSLFMFGAFAFLVPAVAFAQIGFVASVLSARGGSWGVLDAGSPLQFILGYVVPHGLIELPVAMLAAAFGIRIGAALLSPPAGFTVGQNIMWSIAQFLKVWALVVVPLLFLGALIEGLVTPLIIAALYS
jgi:uncharacterized membrane protein SpoIIM required for sporulation/ABC-type transport system involved in multi-copper enzyme maturation permease subunit